MNYINDILQSESIYDVEYIISKLSMQDQDVLLHSEYNIKKIIKSKPFLKSSYAVQAFRTYPKLLIQNLSNEIIYALFCSNHKSEQFIFYELQALHNIVYYNKYSVYMNLSFQMEYRILILEICILYGQFYSVKNILNTFSKEELEDKKTFMKLLDAVYGIFGKNYAIREKTKHFRNTMRKIRKNIPAMIYILLKSVSVKFLKYLSEFYLWELVVSWPNTYRSVKYIYQNISFFPEFCMEEYRNILANSYASSSLDVIKFMENRVCNSHHHDYICFINTFRNPNMKVFKHVFLYNKHKLDKLYSHLRVYQICDIIYSRKIPSKYIIKKLNYIESLVPFPNYFIGKLFNGLFHYDIAKWLCSKFPTYSLSDRIIYRLLGRTIYNSIIYQTKIENKMKVYADYIIFLAKRIQKSKQLWILIYHSINKGFTWNSTLIQFIFNKCCSVIPDRRVILQFENTLCSVPFYFREFKFSSSKICCHYVNLINDIEKTNINNHLRWTNYQVNEYVFHALCILNKINILTLTNSILLDKYIFFQKIKKILLAFILKKRGYKIQHSFKIKMVHQELYAIPKGVFASIIGGGHDYLQLYKEYESSEYL